MYRNCIAITNRALWGEPFLEQVERVAAVHPRSLILREKELLPAAYEELAAQVLAICRAEGVPMFVHSDAACARRIGCDGLHLSMEGLQTLQAAGSIPKDLVLSVSCHSLEEALRAERAGAAQLVLGTIFETACKPGRIGSGLSFLEEVCRSCRIPVYAIGGIKLTNLEQVMRAGAAGGCMMSGFADV